MQTKFFFFELLSRSKHVRSYSLAPILNFLIYIYLQKTFQKNATKWRPTEPELLKPENGKGGKWSCRPVSSSTTAQDCNDKREDPSKQARQAAMCSEMQS
jgi:hypothetical protein